MSKKNKLLTLLLLLILFCLIYPGEDEEKNGSREKSTKKKIFNKIIEEITVTATMTPKALKDISTTVNVLGETDIESSSASSALNILSHMPGIFINRSGDFGRADVEIRGLGQNCRRVAVLVDGKPEKMGLFGCAVSHAYPLDNVHRIEVVQGPASVLYGGEALGGAVNIITRLPENKFETDITSFFGSFNTYQLNLKHGANLDKFKYYFTFDRRHSDGHIKNADYTGCSFTGKFVYDLATRIRLSLQGKYFDGKKYEPGIIDNPVSDYWNDYERGSLDLSLKYEWQKNESLIKIYRNFGKHQFSNGWNSRDYTDGILVRITTRAIANNELTVGGDVRMFGGESFHWPQGEWHKKEGSLFAQNELIINSQWIFSTGLRLQLDSLYGQEWCPHIGAVFQITNNTLFRAAVSKGFRSPQLNELYMYPAANSDLEPERVWNYELGFEHNIVKGLAFKGCLFHMKGTNIIQTIPNPDGHSPYIFANSGEFSFNGAEVTLESFLKHHLSGHISYSYLNTGINTKGKPGQKINISLRFSKKRFLAAIQGQYVTDYYAGNFSNGRIPSYFILNARFIIPVIKAIDLMVDINNILNKDYQIYGEFPGLSAGLYQMPGRNIHVGVRIRP